MKKQSRSLALASKVIFAAFEILKENGGELNGFISFPPFIFLLTYEINPQVIICRV